MNDHDKTDLPDKLKMMSLKKEKKEEEERDGGNPYSNLEKTSVLQEARFVPLSLILLRNTGQSSRVSEGAIFRRNYYIRLPKFINLIVHQMGLVHFYITNIIMTS